MENECVFCKIVRGEIPSGKGKIYEDDDFISVLDINPVGEGHATVISKKHFQLLEELDEETFSKYLKVISKVGKILKEKYNSNGFNVVLNDGKAAGQVIPHIHFHLLPRNEGDNKRGIFLG